MAATLPQPGTTLKNGSTVILALPHPTDPTVCYVGAQVTCSSFAVHPFATWCMALSDRSTFWGHYSKTATDMIDDLRHRSEGK